MACLYATVIERGGNPFVARQLRFLDAVDDRPDVGGVIWIGAIAELEGGGFFESHNGVSVNIGAAVIMGWEL